MIGEVAWLCFLFPFTGALLSPVLGRIHPQLRNYGAVFFSFLAALVSVMFLPSLFHPSKLPIENAFEWLAEREQLISLSGVPYDELRVDLTEADYSTIFLYIVVAIPGLALLTAFAVFWARRQ